MKKTSIIVFVILGMAFSVIAQDNRDIVIDTIDQLLENELQKESMHNIFLSIYSPSRDFEWHGAKGKFNDSTKVTVQHPFYTASIGKTFTAVAIGILVDQSKIQFDDPIF